MRRQGRVKNTDNEFRNLIMWSGGVLIVAVVAFGIIFAIYSNKVKNDSRVSTLNSGKIAELLPSMQTGDVTSDVSKSIGKTVDEVKNDIDNTLENENKIIEEKEENYEDEKFSNFDELKEENKYNDFNNNNKNNNNSIPKEEIVEENENLKEKMWDEIN